MSVRIELPGALEPYAGGRATLEFSDHCLNVRAALARVGVDYGAVRDRVLDERGNVRAHVNIFVDGENIRFLQGLETPLTAGRTTIVILPAVSGG